MKKSFSEFPIETKATIAYLFSGIIQNGLSFLTYPVFTNIMTPGQFGEYSIYLSWMNLFIIFTTLNMHQETFGVSMIKFKDERNQYISSIQGLSLILSFVLFVFLSFFIGRIYNFLGFHPKFILIMFCQMFFSSCTAYWLGKQRYEYKYRNVFAVSAFSSVLSIGLSLLAVYFFQDKGSAKIISEAGVIIAIGFFFCILNFVKGRCFFSKKYWNYAIKFNLPLVIYYLSQMIFNQSDRIMIDYFHGKEKAGIYSLVYNCSVVVFFISDAIIKAITPFAYEQIEKRTFQKLKQYTNLIITGMAVFLGIFMMIGPELIQIISNSNYLEARNVFPVVSGSVFFMCMISLFSLPLLYFEKKGYMLVLTVICAIVNIILNMICIPFFGYVSAGFTTLFSYLLFASGYYIFMNKVLRKEGIREKIYHSRLFFILSLAVLFEIIINMFLYQYTALRYLLFIIIIALILIKKNKIINFIRQQIK